MPILIVDLYSITRLLRWICSHSVVSSSVIATLLQLLNYSWIVTATLLKLLCYRNFLITTILQLFYCSLLGGLVAEIWLTFQHLSSICPILENSWTHCNQLYTYDNILKQNTLNSYICMTMATHFKTAEISELVEYLYNNGH